MGEEDDGAVSDDNDYTPSPPAEVYFEQLRFLATDGSLLAEYGFDGGQVRSLRLADTSFGSREARPLSEAAAHFEALQDAAAGQPLRAADGRVADGLLLPAIHDAITWQYSLQLD